MAFQNLITATFLIVGASAFCDRNLLTDLSFKLSGGSLAFPCSSTRNIYTSSGRYVPRNIIGTRMQIYKEDAIVALPRYKHGVPFTLAKFSLKSKGCLATLEPYPCWALQEEGNPEALQSVVDIFLDQNEILWVLDVGIVNTLEQPVRRSPPKIVGINAKTGQVIKVIDLSQFACAQSRLQYIVAEYTADGRPFVYVSDAGVGAIIVYDVLANKGYRVILPKAVYADCSNKDVLYIAMIHKPCGNVLFFHYLCSPKLFSIKTEFLQKGQAAGAVVQVGHKQDEDANIVILGTDNGAALFFRNKGESDIYIWNTQTCFKHENFLLVQRGDDCKLATQVVPGYKRLMWAIESNFHDFISNTVGCMGPSMAVHPLIKTSE